MNSPYLVSPILEHLSIAVAAVGGVLAAKGKQIDLFGVIMLALVTSFGGGTVRDLLVGDTPVMWLRGPWHLITASTVAFVTFFIARHVRMPHGALAVADAIGLAAFVIIGTRKGIDLSFSPPVCVLLGVLTGTAGGMLRDVLTGEVPFVFRPEIRLYATAAMAGAILDVVLHHWSPSLAATLGFSIILGLRLAAMRWNLCLPIFITKE